MSKKRSFDFFNFFLISMGLLTLVLAILCGYMAYRINLQEKELSFQIYNVEDVKKKIKDPKIRDLIKRKKESLQKGKDQLGVKQLINQIVNRQGHLININYSVRDEPQLNLKKETYTVQLTYLTLHGLMNSLYYIELLPGAKVENLTLTKVQRDERPWDTYFTVSIYIPKGGSKPGRE